MAKRRVVADVVAVVDRDGARVVVSGVHVVPEELGPILAVRRRQLSSGRLAVHANNCVRHERRVGSGCAIESRVVVLMPRTVSATSPTSHILCELAMRALHRRDDSQCAWTNALDQPVARKATSKFWVTV